MNAVYQKLNAARDDFHNRKLKKTGKNTFAGYSYFELGDFLIPALECFAAQGLCAIVSFTDDTASMRIVAIEDGSEIVITSPMGSAALKGCHEVQNIGAVETYQRRYLWVAAMEIVEHDALDATMGKAEPHDTQEPQRQTGQKLAGPITSITGLEKAIKAFAVEMGKVVTFEDWYALKNAHADLLMQAERDHPDWWSGWAGQPDGFTPLRRRIEILEAQLAENEKEAA